MEGRRFHDEMGDIKKGPWKSEEDEVLLNHVKKYGPRDWSSIRSKGLLQRTGKSCRLRWVNKLRPNLKKYEFFSVMNWLHFTFQLCFFFVSFGNVDYVFVFMSKRVIFSNSYWVLPIFSSFSGSFSVLLLWLIIFDLAKPFAWRRSL